MNVGLPLHSPVPAHLWQSPSFTSSRHGSTQQMHRSFSPGNTLRRNTAGAGHSNSSHVRPASWNEIFRE
eukprot:CAMPEP_0119383506 /NCGR_PEP_ID=MMETSP1334-20130426/80039_1 /TAXON_ID=127549 /ORGANISM="Calcidiscus leptoporus, Strain RCC1130" /LENGTH=68 /DNA_ID=CAMNT_0007404329 /DNA_START=182 /DNA_END=385 /DNA_ORIENTATION=+